MSKAGSHLTQRPELDGHSVIYLGSFKALVRALPYFERCEVGSILSLQGIED
ncbi:hypothetical protein ERY430_80037 [Erythrobacter sp. EC-HK427]|nr:hypothetical protein ERY430_80037 [Erythrobacter sp. EC-HK427]